MFTKIINRHFFFQLLGMTILITFILLGILLYGNLVKHDEYLLQAMSVSPYSFLQLSSLLIPYALSFALPFGFMLALLLCYGKWSSSNEILALRSLGNGIFSWGMPCFILSFLVSLISLYTFLQWAPMSRAEFDQKKSAIVWSNINLLLETEKEIEFDLEQNSTGLTNKNLATLSDEPIHRVSLSVGSMEQNRWSNVRILLLGENGNLLRIINSQSAKIEWGADHSKLFIYLVGVDLESALAQKEHNLFVSFREWNEPLVFNFNNSPDQLNLKRVGFWELLEFSNTSHHLNQQASNLIHKSLVFGSSSFFLSLILLPISITKGRRESMTNLTIGIILCLTYYLILTFLVEFSLFLDNPLIIWIPNISCAIIGTYLLYNFDQ